MAAYTTYKSLEKPLSTEKYNVAVVNKNNDIIDSELHKLDLKNQSQDELLATKESLSAETARATESENANAQRIADETTRAISAEGALRDDLTDLIQTDVSDHDISASSHTDIRNLISELTTKLNTLADSDDTTLDQLSEIIAYIKNNKSLIDGITTSKVNVSDIINDIPSMLENIISGKLVDALVVKEVFQSVSNGKCLVASAITDKGVKTDATATFQQIADNIGKIEIENTTLETCPITSPYSFNINWTNAVFENSSFILRLPLSIKNVKKMILNRVYIAGQKPSTSNSAHFSFMIYGIKKNETYETVIKSYSVLMNASKTSVVIAANTKNPEEIDLLEYEQITACQLHSTRYSGTNVNYLATVVFEADLYF